MNGSVLLSPDALHCLKRKQLTNLCRRFGIKAVGKNTDLIQRLQDYAATNIPTDSPTKGNVVVLRHVKRPRQSDSSTESGTDDQQMEERPSLPYPPLTPRTKQKRVSDLVKAIEEVKSEMDDMDTDDENEGQQPSQRNTIAFPVGTPQPSRQRTPLLPPLRLPDDSVPTSPETTQPLRIVKALPSSSRIASPLSTSTIIEMSRTSAAADSSSGLYPDLTSLPIPEGVSSECLASSSTLPSITSRQFSAAAASVLAEMNARLAAAGRSTTNGSLTTLSSVGNGAWQTLAASASAQGMSKSRSGRYEIHHERQFNKMDSIVNHYAARRVGGGLPEKSADTAKAAVESGSAASSSVSTSTSLRMTASTSTRMTASTSTRLVPSTSSQRRPRADASTSTRSLAAMARSTSNRNMPVKRRPLLVPPVSQTKTPTAGNRRQAPIANTDAPRTKRLRLAVSEDQDALQNTVLEIPPEKKMVVIRVTKPEREGMPYKFSVASSDSDRKIVGGSGAISGPTRAASSLRKTVIKATKSAFVGGASAKKSAASGQTGKREAAFAKQQQQQAAMSRSISSRANLAAGKTEGLTASTSVRNRFTGVVTTVRAGSDATSGATSAVEGNNVASNARQPSIAASTSTVTSSKLGGSIRSSVAQGLVRAEAARQTRLQEIKARTKAALAGFGSQRSVSSSTSASTATALTNTTVASSPRKALAFSSSVTRPTIASLNRAAANAASNGSSSVPMLSAITETPLSTNLRRAATIHAGVGQAHTPNLTPRSSSLRHLRRVMRRQQKEADLEQVRIAATENLAPGAVVASVGRVQGEGGNDADDSNGRECRGG